MPLLHRIGQKPVIAAVRSRSDTAAALESGVDNLFFMGGSVTDIIRSVRECAEAEKGAFLHIDLIRGLSSTDKETLPFVKEYVGADGIITPKSHLIKEAGKNGLYAILHLFVLDSLALENGLKLARTTEPDGIEIMPGLMSKVISRFTEELPNIPLIASGLIQTKKEAADSIHAGATALSVSEPSLWPLTFRDLEDL
ncbi:glycerol-3-phosphate responsive antiterminator [Paenibacillus mendelii]|uniref:Glycerol uptake operon antiterminator regulatory protein n=1 Tax=Paenibacillus mendelii TaxID=206163 RepID=A0ABV6JB87_9BACL|nr:glycerol-3-phosphate responsive antiterminator [Paenibacillus mendelii]MCQ6562948.1 glycerol-3-phosphate responsive antiterminator [Paenibacillus mendelii]